MIFERFQTKPFSSKNCDIFQPEYINTVDSERLKSDWYGNFLRHTIFSAASTSSQVNGWEKEIIRLMEFQVLGQEWWTLDFLFSPSSANQNSEEYLELLIKKNKNYQISTFNFDPSVYLQTEIRKRYKKEKWRISILDFDPSANYITGHTFLPAAGKFQISNLRAKLRRRDSKL